MTPEANNTIEFKKPEPAAEAAKTCERGEACCGGTGGCEVPCAEAPAEAPKEYRLRELTEEEGKKFAEIQQRATNQLNAGIDNVVRGLVQPQFRALADSIGIPKSRLHLLANVAYVAAGFQGPLDYTSEAVVHDAVVELALKSGVVKGEPADDGSSDPFLVKWSELPDEQKSYVDLFYRQGLALRGFVEASTHHTNVQITGAAHQLGFLEEAPAAAPCSGDCSCTPGETEPTPAT